MTVEEVLADLFAQLDQAPPELMAMDAVFELNILGAQAVTYQLKIKNQQIEWAKGTPFLPSCIFYLSDTDFLKIAVGELNTKLAIMTGRIKIEGDYGQALQLSAIIKKHYKPY
ncbi:MAG TPA: SCP2 sterol-binding domain-containing protein [Oscillospiraceae bacterium]|nr:SCP2 sterol-binding domain-containing protein [Oscillospiraceae bacterium]